MSKQLEKENEHLKEKIRSLEAQLATRNKEWLTRKEAAAYLGKNVMSIHRYVRVLPDLFAIGTGRKYSGGTVLININALDQVGAHLSTRGKKPKAV